MKSFFIIVYALMIRDINLKFKKGYMSYLWIILEPITHLTIWMLIFVFFKQTAIMGMNNVIFIISGLIPWFIFQRGFSASIDSYKSGRSLFSYKQITLFHVLISKVFLELVIYLVLFVIILAALFYLDINFYIYNLINIIEAFILITLLTIGVSFIVMVICIYFPDFSRIKAILNRPLYFTSGIFFTYNTMPETYKEYLLLNPIFQLIELVRYSFIQFDAPDFINMGYVFEFILTILSLGICLYFINREKITRNDLARE